MPGVKGKAGGLRKGAGHWPELFRLGDHYLVAGLGPLEPWECIERSKEHVALRSASGQVIRIARPSQRKSPGR